MLETTQIQPTFKDLNEIVQDLYELHVHYQNILKIKNFMSFEEKEERNETIDMSFSKEELF